MPMEFEIRFPYLHGLHADTRDCYTWASAVLHQLPMLRPIERQRRHLWDSLRVQAQQACAPLRSISILIETRQIERQKDVIGRCGNIPVYTAEFDVLTQLTGFKLTRGMLCAMYRPASKTVSEICAGARRLAVLERVVNPTNVGAALKSVISTIFFVQFTFLASAFIFCGRRNHAPCYYKNVHCIYVPVHDGHNVPLDYKKALKRAGCRHARKWPWGTCRLLNRT